VKEIYFDSIVLIERLHRLFLEVIKAELDKLKIHDINNIQCFILYNIGNNKLTVGEITNRGYYLGSNVTYNLKKMVENGYLKQEQSLHDRRSSHIELSEKGLELYKKFERLFQDHAANLSHNNLAEDKVHELATLLSKLESFWSFLITHDIRG